MLCRHSADVDRQLDALAVAVDGSVVVVDAVVVVDTAVAASGVVGVVSFFIQRGGFNFPNDSSNRSRRFFRPLQKKFETKFLLLAKRVDAKNLVTSGPGSSQVLEALSGQPTLRVTASRP